MQQMYHPSDLASMDPLVLMKNLDHVRMTSRRLSYILQQQVHLYTPEANQIREQIDRYVEAERQIEGEMARRRIRARPQTVDRTRESRAPASGGRRGSGSVDTDGKRSLGSGARRHKRKKNGHRRGAL